MIDDDRWEALREAAERARANAHAPYSGFAVGAALLAADGSVYVGCNVENASYGATLCAERAALAAAVAAGARTVVALAIVSGSSRPVPPCGICRQCLAELAPSLSIRSYAGDEEAEYSLDELLPHPFNADHL